MKIIPWKTVIILVRVKIMKIILVEVTNIYIAMVYYM